jgi:hypothetical protein
LLTSTRLNTGFCFNTLWTIIVTSKTLEPKPPKCYCQTNGGTVPTGFSPTFQTGDCNSTLDPPIFHPIFCNDYSYCHLTQSTKLNISAVLQTHVTSICSEFKMLVARASEKGMRWTTMDTVQWTRHLTSAQCRLWVPKSGTRNKLNINNNDKNEQQKRRSSQ